MCWLREEPGIFKKRQGDDAGWSAVRKGRHGGAKWKQGMTQEAAMGHVLCGLVNYFKTLAFH